MLLIKEIEHSVTNGFN